MRISFGTIFFYLITLCKQKRNRMNNSERYTRKKGYLKCKSAFSARLDPFVGIWKNNIPIKGFYTEADECTIDNIVNYLNGLNEEDFSEDDSDG